MSVGDLAAACAGLSKDLNDDTWRPVPANKIPAWTTVGAVRLNAAQMLRLMAMAYLEPTAGNRLRVRTCQMFSGAGLLFPSSRPRADAGGIWTLKPAPLHLTEK
jgi:hypothetical protein